MTPGDEAAPVAATATAALSPSEAPEIDLNAHDDVSIAHELDLPEGPGVAAEATMDAEVADAAESTELQWWEQPGMPWKHKPTRSDIACLTWMGVAGLIGLGLLPLRAWLLGQSPIFLLGVLGSRTGAAATGALASVGATNAWWWALPVGAIVGMKFDWLYWWAGKLWGRGIIEVWAGRSKRAAKSYAWVEKWARKMGWVGMFLAYIPIPLPLMQVIFVLAGATGMRLRTFILLDYAASLVWLVAYFLVGYQVGAPAVDLLKQYAKYANYFAIGLIGVVVVSMIFRPKQLRTPRKA